MFRILIILSATLLSACESPKEMPVEETASALTTSTAATTVYINGDILTMNDTQPVAEALAVHQGKILAVGQRAMVESVSGKDAVLKDLNGHTLLPGFIDSHGHISAVMSFMAFENIASPPVGQVDSIADIQLLLSAKAAEVPAGEWIMAAGYDDSLLAEQRHPTKFDLDAVSTEHPIMAWHVSGHLMVCNSPCLELAGYTPDRDDPEGGVIRRVEGSSEPNGILEESAVYRIYFDLLPIHDVTTRLGLLQEAQDYFARFGVTTVQDGAATLTDLETLRTAAGRDGLMLDVVAYPFYRYAEALDGQFPFSQSYNNRFRVGGLKLGLDGSPQGKTAWLTEPYHVPPQGRDADYAGYAIMKDGVLNDYVSDMYERNIPVIAHANGDAAMDQLIRAVSNANELHGRADRRTVIIHAQTARDDQIDAFKAEGMLPSYFATHTYFWGDWHRDSVLGAERGSRISPLASTLARGVPYTIHNDTPVVPPDMMRLVWAAVTRTTRSGETLGEGQKISVEDALKAITINGAYQYFEEASKGSLEPGKLADLVILSDNPINADPVEIRNIKVIETIKEGQTIYLGPE